MESAKARSAFSTAGLESAAVTKSAVKVRQAVRRSKDLMWFIRLPDYCKCRLDGEDGILDL
jgi:hypothetical protein